MLEQIVLEKVRRLPPEQKQEVLDFVEFLEFKHGTTLEVVLAKIRLRAGSISPDELDSLIEEARHQFIAV